MATLAWISAATVAGGVISIAIAAMFALSAPASWVPALVSFAIGTLLGAVFLEILPHAIASTGNLQALFATVLAGILGFFVLEKLVLWRHCHIEDCEAHDHHADPSHGGGDHRARNSPGNRRFRHSPALRVQQTYGIGAQSAVEPRDAGRGAPRVLHAAGGAGMDRHGARARCREHDLRGRSRSHPRAAQASGTSRHGAASSAHRAGGRADLVRR